MSLTCTLKPENNSSIIAYLEREGKLVEPDQISNLVWDEIDKTFMPVCYVKTPTGQYAYVCYNKDQFYSYKKLTLDAADMNERSFYLVKIQTLIDNSTLGVVKHLIEKDRIYEKINSKLQMDPQMEEDLMTDILLNCNRTKTIKQIATNYGVPISSVNYRLNALRRGGAKIPENTRSHISLFLAKAKEQNPRIFGLPEKEQEENSIAKHPMRRHGRPKK